MKIVLALSVAALSFTGVAAAETRPLSGFTRVSASAGTDVEVTVGDTFQVEVTGRDAARIVTRVSGDQLFVHPVRGFSWRAPRDVEIRVTMPRIEGLSVSSGADLTATGINSESVSLDASSGADLRVSGRCGSVSASASSGSDIHAEALRCESGSADVSSGADIRVFASGRLDADASSGGGVIVHGNPGLGDVDLSSGGSVRRASR